MHHVFISALKEQQKLDNEEEFYDSSSDEEEDFKEEEEAEFEPLFGDLKKEIDHDLERKQLAAEERKARIAAGEEVEEEEKEKKTEKEEDDASVEVELDTTRVFTRTNILNFLR